MADLAKTGIRAKQQYIGEIGPFTNRVREGKADPMFEWSWGYYSVFDADAILFDVLKCREPYSYYCNKELDELIMAGRSTLDAKRRTDIYARAQKLLYDDAAYLQVGPARRVGRQQPDRVRGAPGRDRPHVHRDAAEEVGSATGGRARGAPGAGSPLRMRRYFARQLVQLVVVLFGISLLAFGDPARPRRPRPAAPAAERRQGGVRALPATPRASTSRSTCSTGSSRRRAVRGDFGKSWYADTPAFRLVLERMPPTIYLTLAGLVVGAADRAAARHPGGAQAPLLGGQPLHGHGGGRPGDAASSGSASC